MLYPYFFPYTNSTINYNQVSSTAAEKIGMTRIIAISSVCCPSFFRLFTLIVPATDWADQLHCEQNLTSPSPSSAANNKALQSQTIPQLGSYIPTTPRKRSFDSTFPLTPRSEPTPSQKRKKMIEEALRDQSMPTQSKFQTRVAQPTLKHEEENDDSDDALLTPPSSSPRSHNRPSKSNQNGDDPFVVLTPQDTSVTGGSSTIYDPPGRGTELSPDIISTLLSALDGIPEYVRKLERKMIAAEKSSDAKTKKITELEAEIQKYVVKCNI